RKPLVFSYETLDNAVLTYNKLRDKISSLSKDGEVDTKALEEYRSKFIEALSNDINTSSGITLLYDALKADFNDVTKRAIAEDFDRVLSLDLTEDIVEEKIDGDLEAYVLSKIEDRQNAKLNKNYALADEIRNELLEKGIVLKDTKEGTSWSKN
ncbi:MAG: cysteine--tRNA ligase, partial [Oscillospiraceae bacterium]